MPLFEWSEKLDIGIAEMNIEHKMILRYINEVHDANQSGASKRHVLTILEKLQQYTEKHFADEERLMKGMNFAGYETHCEIHRYLSTELTKWIGKYRAGDGQMPEAFMKFLKKWLTSHIMHIDRQYADAFHKRKAA